MLKQTWHTRAIVDLARFKLQFFSLAKKSSTVVQVANDAVGSNDLENAIQLATEDMLIEVQDDSPIG
jgi:hypothetical protein